MRDDLSQSLYWYWNIKKDISFPGLVYEFLPTDRGGQLLMMENYTYSRNHQNTNTYYCSKRTGGKCRALVKLGSDGLLVKANLDHNHEAPYTKINGKYVRIADRGPSRIMLCTITEQIDECRALNRSQ